MYDKLQEDLSNLKKILQQTQSRSLDFLRALNDRPAAVHFSGEISTRLSEQGLGTGAALELFKEKFQQHLSGSAGPRYFGFVTGGSTPAALAGDWLTSAFDQNLAGEGDSIAPQLERETIRLLCQLFGLPESFSGAFVTGATMANFVGLALGRQWVGRQLGVDFAQQGLTVLPRIPVLSGSPHATIIKSLAMLGLGRDAMTRVPCLRDREAIDVGALEAALSDLNGAPCIVVANAGTVDSTDFDDFKAIATLREKYKFWLHIDGAFGGVAACSPKYKHLLAGFELADSITVDAHKWLNVPYESGISFTRHRDLQVEVFGSSGSYLGAIANPPAFMHLTPESSQRFRALPIWMSLMAYGSTGHSEIVERNCALAASLSARIRASDCFELLAPTWLNIVCFTLKLAGEKPSLPQVQAYLAKLRDDGTAYLTQTVYRGTPGIRAAISNWRTQEYDIEMTWQALLRTFEQFTSEGAGK